MTDVMALSDEELRAALIEYGKTVGPVANSTRKFYQNQLMKLMAGGGLNGSLLNDSSTSIPDEPVVVARTPSPTRAKSVASAARKAAAAVAAAALSQEEEHVAASSDEERGGEESMRYLDEEEQEAVRRHLSPNGSTLFTAERIQEIEQQKRKKSSGGVSTIGLVVALALVVIFTVFLLMRSLEMDGEGGNHEEL